MTDEVNNEEYDENNYRNAEFQENNEGEGEFGSHQEDNYRINENEVQGEAQIEEGQGVAADAEM